MTKNVFSCPFIFIFPEPFTQNSTAVIFAAVVVGAVMLFIVVLVLCLRRRSVLSLLHHPPLLSSPFPSVCPVNQSDFPHLPPPPRPPPPPVSSLILSPFLSRGPPRGLCIHSLLTSLCPSSFCQLSLSLYLDLCPRHSLGGRICHECALSSLNGYILVSVGSF